MKLIAYIYLVLAIVFWGVLGIAIADHPRSGTELRVQLQDTISTEDNRAGDRFRATVMAPGKYEGAVVQGRVTSIKRSSTMKGRTRMHFKFDRITLPDGTSRPITADLLQVYESGAENVKRTTEEGTVESGKQSKKALKRGAIGAAAGAVLGGLAGGKSGAAIGILVGGAGGAASVAVTGRKELKLESGTEMLIRIR